MTVREKLMNRDYNNELTYPERAKKPVLAKDASPAAIREYADAVENYAILEEAFKTKLAIYNQETADKMEQFRTDVEDENGMTFHPKADLLWSKAWEIGHSGGYGEVLAWYENLIDLVK